MPGIVACTSCGEEVEPGSSCGTCGAPDPRLRSLELAAGLDERLLLRIDAALDAKAQLARRVAAERGEAAARLCRDADVLQGRIRRQSEVLRTRLAQSRAMISALEEALERTQESLDRAVVDGDQADGSAPASDVGAPAGPVATAQRRAGTPEVPASVCRALAFIQEHLQKPIQIGEVAAVAGVSPRALQYGFRRHVGMRPMDYLRLIRLEHAHRVLCSATEADGLTVRGVAKEWGFGNAGRFAADYRAMYGESPSRTLRRC